MGQIGTIRLQTQNNGTVDVPVFNTGDSGSSTYEFVRVQTASGTGFIPVIDPADAAYPYLRVQSQNNGVVAVTDSASAIPDSVVNRWQHEDGSGSTLTDSEGSLNGTISGASWTTNAKQGDYALSYATDNYVNLGAIPSYSTFTIVGWLYLNSNSSRGTLVDIRANQGYHIRGEGDGTVELLYYDGSYSIIAQPSVNTGQWYHFGLAYDGSDAIAFQDGTEIGRASKGAPTSVDESQDVLGSKASLDDQFLDGRTDDVMAFSEALTESQIQDVINATT